MPLLGVAARGYGSGIVCPDALTSCPLIHRLSGNLAPLAGSQTGGQLMMSRSAGKRFATVVAPFAAAILAISSIGATGAAAVGPAPGDPTITVSLNDSTAGGSYDQVFEKAFSGTTPDGTPVYIYVPLGGIDDPSVASLNPQFDPNPSDAFVPCATTSASRYVLTQAQIDYLGQELASHIVAVNVDHFGGITGGQDNAVVTLVYNVQDDSYYDCAVTTYTAGYFAPEFLAEYDMNVMVIDAFDWANRIGDQTGNPNGRTQLYEGVFAHELEHLLMNYSDPGELSWVDEGLADFAIFLNDYSVGGSHLTYHQVFHRETSLTRWAGGLENYGASYTWTQYLWEQAGGNGPGADQYAPDGVNDHVAGDLLVQMLFEEPADGMEGVQNVIDDFNALGGSLRPATELFQDWALAVYLDQEGSSLFDIRAADFGDPAFTRWTIELANDVFWDGRGIYTGAMPEAKWENFKRVPSQSALPFGVSYETFKNPGPTFSVMLDGSATTQVAPHSGDTHWYGGFESQADKLLEVTSAIPAGGASLDFWTWYFIEEGWDYGFVEVSSDGVTWTTIPLTNDAGATVTTNDDPHDNNTEGNGLTGTSGGAYFVDQPQYIHLNGAIPAGATEVRFRYSTDAAYLDTGWFVDDVMVGGAAATVASAPGNWIATTGVQNNHFVVQLVSPCDLTPNTTISGEFAYEYGWVYRLAADANGDVDVAGFSTRCLNSTRDTLTAVISNMPTGDLQYLDAGYLFRVVNTSNRK